MKQTVLPSVVLTVVCTVVCGLLSVVQTATSERIAQAERAKVQKSLTAVFGEGTYTETAADFDGVTAVYEGNGLTIFDVTSDGYAKGGIRALVGVAEDGTVSAVGIVSCNETAGVGTKVTETAYLNRFAGASGEEDYPDAVSGATFSSRGLHSAVALAQACALADPHQAEEVP